jgi:hypothetical protein
MQVHATNYADAIKKGFHPAAVKAMPPNRHCMGAYWRASPIYGGITRAGIVRGRSFIITDYVCSPREPPHMQAICQTLFDQLYLGACTSREDSGSIRLLSTRSPPPSLPTRRSLKYIFQLSSWAGFTRNGKKGFLLHLLRKAIFMMNHGLSKGNRRWVKAANGWKGRSAVNWAAVKNGKPRLSSTTKHSKQQLERESNQDLRWGKALW